MAKMQNMIMESLNYMNSNMNANIEISHKTLKKQQDY